MNLPYLEFVDVDLSLLVSFRAHIHRSADQEEIRVGICIHVDSLQDAAEVGTDLPNKAAVDETTALQKTQRRTRKQTFLCLASKPLCAAVTCYRSLEDYYSLILLKVGCINSTRVESPPRQRQRKRLTCCPFSIWETTMFFSSSRR